MLKKELRSDYVLSSVDETIKDVFMEAGAKAIYGFLENNSHLKFVEIAEKPAGPHKVPLTVVNGAGDGPTLLVNGGIHGSEYNGPAACLQVLKDLDPTKVSGKVIIVPIVNTLAFEGRSVHGNPIDHRDLSGLFVPDSIREIPKRGSGSPVISYQVAQIFYKECLAKANYRMDLHGGDIEEDLAVFSMYRKLGIDPEMDKAALKLARNFGWDWIRESLPRGPPPKETLKMLSGPQLKSLMN